MTHHHENRLHYNQFYDKMMSVLRLDIVRKILCANCFTLDQTRNHSLVTNHFIVLSPNRKQQIKHF